MFLRSIARRFSVPAPKSGVDWGKFGFGLNLAEESKMVMLQCKLESGWSSSHKIDVMPYQQIPMHPAATILNYGQGIFEGIKAHRTSKGRICVFRPDQNGIRFGNGAESLSMPRVPQSLFLEALSKAVTENAHLVPPQGEGSLYLRPILYGSGGVLGLGPSTEYTFLIYVSPVGEYFKGVTGGARMKVETEHNRAAIKGSGNVKAGGNYAPCFKQQKKARSEGYTDIIYFDNAFGKHAEEVACANLFLVQPDRVCTPPLGQILPGITRASIMHLISNMKDELGGRSLFEGDITQDDFSKASEAFCTGTATVISPIEHIGKTESGTSFNYDYDPQGPILTKLKKTLIDIQTENVEDKYGWVRDPFSAEFVKE